MHPNNDDAQLELISRDEARKTIAGVFEIARTRCPDGTVQLKSSREGQSIALRHGSWFGGTETSVCLHFIPASFDIPDARLHLSAAQKQANDSGAAVTRNLPLATFIFTLNTDGQYDWVSSREELKFSNEERHAMIDFIWQKIVGFLNRPPD